MSFNGMALLDFNSRNNWRSSLMFNFLGRPIFLACSILFDFHTVLPPHELFWANVGKPLYCWLMIGVGCTTLGQHQHKLDGNCKAFSFNGLYRGYKAILHRWFSNIGPTFGRHKNADVNEFCFVGLPRMS